MGLNLEEKITKKDIILIIRDIFIFLLIITMIVLAFTPFYKNLYYNVSDFFVNENPHLVLSVTEEDASSYNIPNGSSRIKIVIDIEEYAKIHSDKLRHPLGGYRRPFVINWYSNEKPDETYSIEATVSEITYSINLSSVIFYINYYEKYEQDGTVLRRAFNNKSLTLKFKTEDDILYVKKIIRW